VSPGKHHRPSLQLRKSFDCRKASVKQSPSLSVRQTDVFNNLDHLDARTPLLGGGQQAAVDAAAAGPNVGAVLLPLRALFCLLPIAM